MSTVLELTQHLPDWLLSAQGLLGSLTASPGAMLEQPFMRHAFLAGTFIALAAGLVGYFLVLRGQVFAGDMLSHVTFAGALAALAAGVDLRLGLFVATIAVGLGLAALGERGRADDVLIGATFAWILGLGVFFMSVFIANRSASNGAAATRVLFGSIFGLNLEAAQLAALIGGVIAMVTLVIARPLLFASLDPEVASAHGVPVKLLGVVFLGLAGACAAEATQAVGALILLGLLAAPAGAAHRLTTRPYLGIAISVSLAIASVWIGLYLSYVIPRVPPSFAIMAVAAGGYTAAFVMTVVRGRRWMQPDDSPSGGLGHPVL